MTDRKKGGARIVAITILSLVGAANLGYAAYRFTEGLSDNLPLVIGGLTCGTLAIVLAATGRPAPPEPPS